MSDQLNHSSLLVGMKTSGAKISIFNHNGICPLKHLNRLFNLDINDLEQKLRHTLCADLSRKVSTIKKVLIVVEGIYSKFRE